MVLFCCHSVSPLLPLQCLLFPEGGRRRAGRWPRFNRRAMDGPKRCDEGRLQLPGVSRFPPWADFPPHGPISPPPTFFFRSIVSGKWCVGFLIDTFYDFEDGDNRNLETLAISKISKISKIVGPCPPPIPPACSDVGRRLGHGLSILEILEILETSDCFPSLCHPTLEILEIV